MPLRAGDQVDHYTLVKPLGEGGQGSVWQVVDPRAGGVVRALKLVRLEDTGRAGFARARREAKILAAAKHPALVSCHGLFEDLHAGVVGLVVDLVSGGSLAEATADGRLDRPHAFAALEQIASALAYVHGAGLVHRDLKPDNVLLATDFWERPEQPGLVKLVDFGIAAPADNNRPLTSTGVVVGTIPYMAPELVDPASWGRAEGAARDLFAFGVMAWEILFRRHPTGLGPGASMIDHARAYKAAQAGVIAWPPSGLEGPWGAAVGACLALRPADRPANGAELLRILRTGAAPKVGPAADEAALSAPTAPHRPVTPSVEATVPMRSRAPVETTLPMPRAAPTPPKPMRWALIALVFVASMIAVAAALFSTGWLESLFRGPREPETPSPPPATAPVSTAPPIAAAPNPSAIGACCPTERTDCKGPTRFVCLPCPGPRPAIPRGASWSLRVEGARSGKEDLVKSRSGAVLTMRLGDATQVVPFERIRAKRAGDASLRVTTEDVESGRIRFTITDGGDTLADGGGHLDASKGRQVLVSALCAGLVLYVPTPAGASANVLVYLDP